jgi:hypothetical protein
VSAFPGQAHEVLPLFDEPRLEVGRTYQLRFMHAGRRLPWTGTLIEAHEVPSHAGPVAFLRFKGKRGADVLLRPARIVEAIEVES